MVERQNRLFVSLFGEKKKKYEKWLKSKIVSLSLLALCLSVLSCANCQLPIAICHLPFASVLLKKKMKNGAMGVGRDKDGR